MMAMANDDVVVVRFPLDPVRRAAAEEFERTFARGDSFRGTAEGSGRRALRQRIEDETQAILSAAGITEQVTAAIHDLLPAIIREVVGEELAKYVRVEMKRQKGVGVVQEAARDQLPLAATQPAGE